MHFSGSRRARGIILLLSLLLVIALWRVTQLYVRSAIRDLVPTLIDSAQRATNREIKVGRVIANQPGLLVLEQVRVSRGKTFAAGDLLTARKLELRYNPALITWGSLVTRGLGVNAASRLHAEGVHIEQPVPLPRSELLAADTVDADFDLGPLLRGSKEFIQNVSRIDLGHPRARVSRDAKGDWSFEPLLKLDKSGKPTRFRGIVRAFGANVELVDSGMTGLPAPQQNHAKGDFTVSWAAYPYVQFDMRAQVAGQHAGDVILQGHREGKLKRWFLTTQARSGALDYWYHYFVKTDTVQPRQARGSASITLWTPESGPDHWHYRVSADLVDTAGRVTGVKAPIERFAGHVTADPGLITVDGSGTVAGMPVRAVGEVQRTDPAGMQFRLSTDHARLAAIHVLVPKLPIPDGLVPPAEFPLRIALNRAGGEWSVTGEASAPQVQVREAVAYHPHVTFATTFAGETLAGVTGKVDAAAIRYRDKDVEQAHADFEFRGDVLRLKTRMAGLGGEADAQGWMDWNQDPPKFYASGSLRGISARLLPLPEDAPKVSGSINGTFVASGTTKAPVVEGYVHSAPLVVNEERVADVSGRVEWAGEKLRILAATVRDPRVTAAVSGTVTKAGDLDLHLTAGGVDLTKLLEGRSKEPIHGTAYASAEITGTSKAPKIQASLQVYHPSFRSYEADYAEAGITASGLRDVQVSGLKLVRDETRVTANQVHLTRADAKDSEWIASGEATVTGLSLVRALMLGGATEDSLKQEPVSAELGPIRLAFSGPLSASKIQFSTEGKNAAFNGLDLGQVQVAGSYDMGSSRVDLARLSVKASQLSADLRGSITLEPEAKDKSFSERAVADLQFTAGDLRVAALIRRYFPQIREQIALRGRLALANGRATGHLNAPRASFEVNATQVVLNDAPVTVRPFTVDWAPGAALAKNVRAEFAHGFVEAPFVAVKLNADKDTRIVDRLAGEVRVEGVPVALVRQLLEDSPYYNSEAGTKVRELLAEWTAPIAGVVTGRAELTAGPGAPADAVQAAQMLARRTGPARAVATVSVKGIKSPPDQTHVAADLSGSFNYQGGRIGVEDLRVQQPGGVLITANGSAVQGEGKDPGKLDLHLAASGVRLATLSRFPIAALRDRFEAYQPIDGTAEMDATVTGSTERPHAKLALLKVTKPLVMGVPFDEFTVQNAEYFGELREKAKLVIGDARVLKRLGEGSEDARILASGTLPVSWPELNVPRTGERAFKVTVPEQSLAIFTTLANDVENDESLERRAPERIRSLAGTFRQIADTKGKLAAGITLAGTADQPKNSGAITLKDGGIRLAGADTEVKNLNAQLDLLGNRLEVTTLHGDGNYGGSFDVGGDLTFGRQPDGDPGARFNLTVAVNRFRVAEKKVERFAGKGFKGTEVSGTLQTVSAGNPDRDVPITITGEWPEPTVAGGLMLSNSKLRLAFNDLATPTRKALPVDARLNLRVIAGRNVRLDNQAISWQMTGSLLASNTLSEPVVQGDLHAQRGTAMLPTLRLRNVEGLIRVSYDARTQELSGPQQSPIFVDLTGSSNIRIQRSATQEVESYDLTVEIRGSPVNAESSGFRTAGVTRGVKLGAEEGLTITVHTDPPLPGAQIEALIRQQFGAEGFQGNGANVVEALRSQVEEALASNAASFITSGFEQKVENALGLSLFSIDVGVTQPVRLSIGRRLFGPVFGTVSQGYSPSFGYQERRFEVYYRFSPQLRFGVRQEQPGDRTVFFLSGTLSFR